MPDEESAPQEEQGQAEESPDQGQEESAPNSEDGQAEESQVEKQAELPGDMDSVGDLVKSYENLRKDHTKKSQQKSELEQKVDTLQKKIEQTEDTDEETISANFANMLAENPRKAIGKVIQEEIAPWLGDMQTSAFKSQVREIQKSNPDLNMGELAPVMTEVIEDDSSLTQDPRGAYKAFERAKGRMADDLVQQAYKRGKQEVLETNQKKDKATAESGGASSKEEPSEEEQIKKDIIDAGRDKPF